jgi:hypothetical protein
MAVEETISVSELIESEITAIELEIMPANAFIRKRKIFTRSERLAALLRSLAINKDKSI